jgi:GR25 family glycosyltransferase involved in LPS biosynthesis
MKTYCINLDGRPDRWQQTQYEAAELWMDPIRFRAIKHERGHTGCKASHMQLLKQVKDEGKFIIIEDDIKVLKNGYDIAWEAFQQLPRDWDMFYFGATLTRKLDRYSRSLYRLRGGAATQCIMYNNQNGVVDYILDNHNRNRFSAFLRDDVQEHFNCFVTNPMAVTQRPGYSDLLNKRTSGKEILRAYKKYTR